MIALEWLRQAGAEPRGDRLASSLAAGSGRSAGRFRSARAACATLLGFDDPRRANAWRPAATRPLLVLFCGHLDNGAEIAGALNLPAPVPGDSQALAALYGRALRKWGSQTDRRLIGEYAAIALDEDAHSLRLARSPLRAPPLHYYADRARVIASSAVRAIFACGVVQELDEAKLADMAWFNASDEARSWYRGLARVPLGSTVTLTPDSSECEQYYDIASLPAVPKASSDDYLHQAHALLEDGTRAALAGSKRPALMLSGGLDSSLVAVKTLGALPDETPLNTYTFVVEPGWGDHAYRGRFADERPFVEAFCAWHPRIVPHYFDNADRKLGTRLSDLFMATGSAPQGLANLSGYHALWEAARADGCDRVLLGEFGNLTASADGSWAYSEYLLHRKWRQLALALRHAPDEGRAAARRFAALVLMPFLSDRLWRWQRKARKVESVYELASPLRRSFAESSGAVRRAAAAGLPNPRYPIRDRLTLMNEVHSNAWGEFSDVYHGFAQIHGIDQRDPFAYRPFFEFCAGLPSEMFLRDGQQRWLAREMLHGAMPEAQRLTSLTGRHNADWHRKLTRQRDDLLREVEQFSKVPRLAAMLDLDRVRAALENWPKSGEVADAERILCETVVPRAVILGRFINYVEGRNLPHGES